MSKPASDSTIKELSINMGNVINDCFPILRNSINGLSKLEKPYILGGDIDTDSYNNYRKVLEIHSSVLYVILEVACAFRADFHSNLVVEKRVNLKYVVYITSEFFKAFFSSYNKKKSQWDNVSVHLSSLNIDAINNGITEVNENIPLYKKLYYDKDKNNRELAVHYDHDLIKLYEYIKGISEETEAQRLCAFMAMLQPLNNLLSLYSILIVLNVKGEVSSKLSEHGFEHEFFERFKEKNYLPIGKYIQLNSELLDKNMRIYSSIERLPLNITSILGDEGVQKLMAMREYANITILLLYIYIDLGTAIRNYLRSESFFEKRWNLIRVNLIIYEGWKKIYKPQSSNDKSLWEQYILNSLIQVDDKEINNEVKAVNSLLGLYESDKIIENIRHKYVHIRKDKKNYLPDLFDELLKLNSCIELGKSLDFLNLLHRIISLNKKSIKKALEGERNYNREKMQNAFNLLKSKISELNMSEDSKNELIKTIEDEENKIINLIK